MPLIISNQCPYYLLLVVTMGGGPGNKQYLKLIGILNLTKLPSTLVGEIRIDATANGQNLNRPLTTNRPSRWESKSSINQAGPQSQLTNNVMEARRSWRMTLGASQ